SLLAIAALTGRYPEPASPASAASGPAAGHPAVRARVTAGARHSWPRRAGQCCECWHRTFADGRLLIAPPAPDCGYDGPAPGLRQWPGAATILLHSDR